MAEAWARSMGLEADSAGTEPAPSVSRNAIAAMAESGIDLTGHAPKMLDWDTLDQYDRTITMGCGVAESCPALHTDEDWGLDDPVGKDMDAFRACRDDIKARVRALAESVR